MRIEFVCERSLPPLAYCLSGRGESWRLTHGSMVATGDTFFHDGAWAGDFTHGDFESVYNCGTGGLIKEGTLRLVTPEVPIECIYVVRERNVLCASNSMAFLLEVIDDSLDVNHLRYRDEMLAVEWGVRLGRLTLPTAAGRSVQVLFGGVATIDPSGSVGFRYHPRAEPIRGWSQYRSMLAATMAAVVENAADSARTHRFEAIVPLSTGYDSTAVAALAAELGITDSVTMLRYDPDSGSKVDYPGETAQILGLNMKEVARDTWRERADMPEARLAASMTTISGISQLNMDNEIAGRLLINGCMGDIVWDANNNLVAKDVVHPYGIMDGRSLIEHRLHAGYIRFGPAEISMSAHPSIHALSVSSEMAPWRLGNNYDRPVARRIGEEASVRRDSFGVKKYGSSARVGHSLTYYPSGTRQSMYSNLIESMSSQATESFLDFLGSIDTERHESSMKRDRVWHWIYEKSAALEHHASQRLRRLGVRFVIPRRAMRQLARRARRNADYTRWLPHWGIEQTKGAYKTAAQVVQHAARE